MIYNQFKKKNSNGTSNITVQLVFSDSGAPRFRETFYEFYAIALLPYVLGVPHDRVTLVLRDYLARFSDDTIDEEHNSISVDGIPLFSDDYKEYFKGVYRNAQAIGDLGEHELSLPVCSIRVICGHGHGHFGGGNIPIGHNKIRWPTLGAAPTHLTVLDICNAAYAVAHFEGETPHPKKWHRFDEDFFFETDDLSVPVVCDKNPGTYAFRVGFDGQSASSNPEAGTGRMSRSVGDAVVVSLLLAIKQFVESGFTRVLDELFCENCRLISPALIPHEMKETGVPQEQIPKNIEGMSPYSNLTSLEASIRQGVVRINMDKFHCRFFALRAEWFLSTERVRALSPGDRDLAEAIVSFVVDSLKKFYHKSEETEYHDSEVHWNTLIRRMGPFRGLLTAIRLEMDDCGNIIQSPKGLPLKAWASSCAEMERIDSAVAKKIMTGSW